MEQIENKMVLDEYYPHYNIDEGYYDHLAELEDERWNDLDE